MNTIPIQETKQRIQLVDALRGFALLGIVIFHNLEQFNFFTEHPYNPDWAKAFDPYVWQVMGFLFSGKAYAIFSILFGFSFWVQYANQKARGNHFATRFAWRMLLLVGFGTLHATFYNGDILTFYAVLSFVLILSRNWSNKAVLILAAFLLLQPIEWVKMLIALQDPNYSMPYTFGALDSHLYDFRINGPMWKLMLGNLTYGQLSNFDWIWEYGRVCQAPGLFLLGMVLARTNSFSEVQPKRWIKIGAVSLVAFAFMYWVGKNQEALIPHEGRRALFGVIVWMYSSLPQTLLMISIIILAWHYVGSFRKIFGFVAPYGRMSLTNYITQSIIGTTVYFGYGLGFHKYCGATLSMCVGICIFSVQLAFSHWWLNRYKQGPLEWLWKKGTWIGAKKKVISSPAVPEAAEA